MLKLEKVEPGKPCFSHQVKRCRGACMGLETISSHTERLVASLASLAFRPWPFAGPIAFREGTKLHVVNRWAYLGMTSSLDQARAMAVLSRPFDHDVYRLLVARMRWLEENAVELRPPA